MARKAPTGAFTAFFICPLNPDTVLIAAPFCFLGGGERKREEGKREKRKERKERGKREERERKEERS